MINYCTTPGKIQDGQQETLSVRARLFPYGQGVLQISDTNSSHERVLHPTERIYTNSSDSDEETVASTLTPGHVEVKRISGASNSVLAVNADTENSFSANEIPLTAAEMLSPVEVIRHAPSDWRRFSTNFVSQNNHSSCNQDHCTNLSSFEDQRKWKPSSEGPQTQQPFSEGPQTQQQPSSEGPQTRQQPFSEGPQTRQPSSEGPQSQQPFSEGPQTRQPSSEGPQSQQPFSEGPQTRKPSSNVPQTRQSSSKGPQTRRPLLEGPLNWKPSSKGSQTRQPSSEGLQTRQPSSEGQQTRQPSSEGLQTRQPSSEGQQTRQPSSEGQQTRQPLSESPQTRQPLSTGPQTRQPSSGGHTTRQPFNEDPQGHSREGDEGEGEDGSVISSEDSLDITELVALADSVHQNMKENEEGWGGGLSTIREEKSPAHPGGSQKKTKQARAVPSRYMSSVSKKAPLPAHNKTSNYTRKAVAKPSAGVNKSKLDDSFKIPPVKPKVLGSIPSSRGRPQVTTSTPAAAVSGNSFMAATPHLSVIHDGSFISGNSTHDGTFSEPAVSISSAVPAKSSKLKAQNVSDWEMELWTARLLHATYADSWRSLRQQEEQACMQLCVLRKCCDEQKRSNLELKKSILREEHLTVLDKTLHTQLQGLEPVCGQLSLVEHCYRSMHRALDSTRHEVALEGFVPVAEDQIQEELNISEALLGDILATVGGKIPKVVNLAGMTKALYKTLESSQKEIKRCWKELAKVREALIHETSLFFEEAQRSH
ncbi:hypothetical protein EMCRGX_G023812 [Ephydatia muelleri]